jgi:hypothetical protein
VTLDDALQHGWPELAWRCADQTAIGADVVQIARPGLQLTSAPDAPMVPRAVFHDWVYGCAERLLRAYVGYGHLEDHESDWLAQAIAIVATTGEPREDADEIRGLAMMTLASVNTFAAIRQRPREMGSVYEWAGDALTWATKRQLGDRRCPHDPVTLARRARQMQGDLARLQGGSAEAATQSERVAQLEDLVSAWSARRSDGAEGR